MPVHRNQAVFSVLSLFLIISVLQTVESATCWSLKGALLETRGGDDRARGIFALRDMISIEDAAGAIDTGGFQNDIAPEVIDNNTNHTLVLNRGSRWNSDPWDPDSSRSTSSASATSTDFPPQWSPTRFRDRPTRTNIVP